MRFLSALFLILTISFFVAGSQGRLQKYLKPKQRLACIRMIDALIEAFDPPAATPIDVQEIVDIAHSGKQVLWLDARPDDERAVAWIRGARSSRGFSTDTFDPALVLVVVYDTVGWNSLSVAKELNLTKHWRGVVRSLRGGLLAWLHSGHFLEGPRGQASELKVETGWLNLGPEGFKIVWD